MTSSIKDLRLKAEKIRLNLLDVIFKAQAGHIGGDLSSINMLTALYFRVLNIDPANPGMENRDRFIMSKGHCAEALYCVLQERGFITEDTLRSYGSYNSLLGGHPTVKVPGVELNSGALGHGLSVGVGLAIAAKMDDKSYKTYVLMGDGEQGEGSIYEAAMAACHYKLDNLVAIIDRNGLQISDATEKVMSLEPLRERWEAFGWDVTELDGDNMSEITKAYENIDFKNSRPHLLISHTTKGKGISFMENVLKWHHGVCSQKEYEQAHEEICAKIKEIEVRVFE